MKKDKNDIFHALLVNISKSQSKQINNIVDDINSKPLKIFPLKKYMYRSKNNKKYIEKSNGRNDGKREKK